MKKLFLKIWIPLFGVLFAGLVISGVSAAKFEIEQKAAEKQEVSSKKQEEKEGRTSSVATTNRNQDSGNRKQDKTKKDAGHRQTTSYQLQATKNQEETNRTKSQTQRYGPTLTQPDYVYMVVDSGPATGYYYVEYKAGENAFSMMHRMASKYHFSIEYTDWGGSLGAYIDCIGGLCRDTDYSPSWSLYLNGDMSMVGASGLIPKIDDTVEWRFQSF